MTKQERIDFIKNHSEGVVDYVTKRCIDLVNEETEIWDFDLFKKVFFNEKYVDNIYMLSINYYSNYNHSYDKEYYINYYSFSSKIFCFSSRTMEEFKNYQILLRKKKLDILLQ